MKIDRRSLLLSAGAFAAAGPARAQSYPAKQVTIYVPFTAGSGTDTMARIFAERLTAVGGQPVVVDNKPGANGSLAAVATARSAPDGHGLMITTNTTHAANPALFKSLPYDPVKDFEPVALFGLAPFLIVATPNAPFNNLAEFVAHAKANPGKLTFGAGTSTAQVSGEYINRLLGLDTLRVPYKSAPPALSDVMSGNIHYTFIDVGTGLPHIRAGRVKAIVSTSSQRSPNLPDVPTMREQGAAFDLDAWYAMYAPAKTPRPIVERLNEIVRVEFSKPEMQQRMRDFNVIMKLGTPDDLLTFEKAEIAKWAKFAKEAGIEPEG
ncbi:MAG: tripartite tricarboxylate transporter substrate binding protein [Proteobacteria bacterium]|nr:tripartite tricarboxylate transporter substrate binding protein [Pseudomonadota bacterium]MBS0549278.1 tripartite tricarboxylate transporter substrate binding protein [Pseudomonadota bacterium]